MGFPGCKTGAGPHIRKLFRLLGKMMFFFPAYFEQVFFPNSDASYV